MGYSIEHYVGAYLEVGTQRVEALKDAVSCSEACGKAKAGQKFCPECGAVVRVQQISKGFKDQKVSLPDELCNLIFSPPNGIEESAINAWLPNYRNSGWSIPAKKALNFEAQTLEACKKALLDSKAGQDAMAYLQSLGVEFNVRFGALTYYI